MRIGLVCPYNMITHAGGVQECVLALQHELNNRGHEATIITPLPQGYNGKTPAETVFIGKSKRIRTPQHTSPDVAISVDLNSIDQLLADKHFDIIHIHEPLVPFLPMQMLPRVTCPVVGTFHATTPETLLAKTLAGSIGIYVKSILKYLDVVTAVSPAATSYIDHYEHAPVIYIPNGIDLDIYKPLVGHKTVKDETILYVGRLEARKGVKHLIIAYADVIKGNPHVKLIIAGEGPDRPKLEKYVADCSIPRVSFRGFVSQADKVRLLQNSSLFCSPALFGESFGIVLLEAMACGLPIVAGDNQGYASVLQGRGRLSLVNPNDTSAFVRQIELLLYDKVLRDAWKQWARDLIKTYDYSKIVDGYEAAYKQALHKTR
jgi:phosphatidylinositol alpha-mannosyltransferase